MILRCLLFFLVVATSCSTAQAALRELTIFSDGTLIELEATAKKGGIELQLPGQIKEGTLRIKPLDNGTVGRVELLPFRIPEKQQKELDNLTEQKSRLEDRLKALDAREGIFAAAAKSQSSKAPRKTKANPDPLASVRQGTDFAIAQLEAVFTARRKTDQELKRVEARLAALRKKAIGGPTVKAAVSPAGTRIRVAAVQAEGGWTPRYEIRLQGDGAARLTMLAELPALPDGFAIRVVPTALSAGQPQQSFPLPVGGSARLAEWQLMVEKEQVTNGPVPAFNVIIKNNSNVPMPAGQIALYSAGEYIGTAALPAMAVGSSATLSSPR